jgi:hypothetical protein
MPRQTGGQRAAGGESRAAARPPGASRGAPHRSTSGAAPRDGTMTAVQISADRATPPVRLAVAAAARAQLLPGEA